MEICWCCIIMDLIEKEQFASCPSIKATCPISPWPTMFGTGLHIGVRDHLNLDSLLVAIYLL